MNNIMRAQYYANEVCNSCATIAAFVASFIAVVIGVLKAKKFTDVIDVCRTSNVIHLPNFMQICAIVNEL